MRFSQRIIGYLNRAGSDRSRKMSVLAAVAPIAFFSTTIALIILSYRIGVWLDLPLIPTLLKYIVGPPFLIIGIVAMIGSVTQFLIVKGTPVPLRPPPKLVTGGLYRYVRNPMFGGLFLFTIGLGFWLRSISLGCLPVSVFVPLLALYLKGVEEPELEARFGRDYVEYKSRTPRFFPRLMKSD